MHSLTQNHNPIPQLIQHFSKYLEKQDSIQHDILGSIQFPLCHNISPLQFQSFVNSFVDYSKNLTQNLFSKILEDADMKYRNSEERKSKYYVNKTYKKTILMPFGYITFSKTYYVHKETKESYCYIDECLNFKKRQRTSDQVIAMIVKEYADSNSMIKTGKHIAHVIHGNYDRPLSRQTIFNLIKKVGEINLPTTPVSDTPETLYIMADEKWIASQSKDPVYDEDGNRIKLPKTMVKAAVFFEGVKAVKGYKTRKALINPYVITSHSKNFGTLVSDTLIDRYDIDKIKNIYVLGDGATWIKSLCFNVNGNGYKVKYGLDKFHFKQSINRITTDDSLRKILPEYIIKGDMKSFKEIIEAMKQEKPLTKIQEQNVEYIITNAKHIRTTYKEVPAGCAMEQAISHIFASVFSSVPKAYNKNNLTRYLQNRASHYNNTDIHEIVINKLNEKDGINKFDDHKSFDSIFDRKKDEPHKVNLSNFI